MSKKKKFPAINIAGQSLETHLMFEFRLRFTNAKAAQEERTHTNFDETVGSAMLRMHKAVQKVMKPEEYQIICVHRLLRKWLKPEEGGGYRVEGHIEIDDWREANPANPDISLLPKAPTKKSDKTDAMFDDEEIEAESEKAERRAANLGVAP